MLLVSGEYLDLPSRAAHLSHSKVEMGGSQHRQRDRRIESADAVYLFE